MAHEHDQQPQWTDANPQAPAASAANADRRVNFASPFAMKVKLGLAGLLLGVFLLVVLPRKQTPSGCDAALENSPSPAPVANSVSPSPAAASTSTAQRPRKVLPSINLEAILARNPFQGAAPDRAGELRPVAVDVAPSNSGSQELAAANAESASPAIMRNPPAIAVSAIITGKGRPAALVGDRLIFENDVVQDQWRVVAIRPAGLLLEPISRSESGRTP